MVERVVLNVSLIVIARLLCLLLAVESPYNLIELVRQLQGLPKESLRLS